MLAKEMKVRAQWEEEKKGKEVEKEEWCVEDGTEVEGKAGV